MARRNGALAAVLSLGLMATFGGCLGDRPLGHEVLEGSGGQSGSGAAGTKGSGGAAGKGNGGAAGGNAGAGGGAIGGTHGSGGTSGTGGSSGAPGTGGASSTGGAPGSGGVTATGGMKGTGGVPGTGGVTATGGVKGTGGVPATGGAPGAGGVPATGGAPGTGGAPATGGVTGTGGAPAVCTSGQTRCVNNNTQEEDCQSNGQWGNPTTCSVTCVGSTCAACVPGSKTCSGFTANQTCGNDGQWETAVACPLPYPPNPACMAGNCAYHAGLDVQGGTDMLAAGYIYAIRFQAAADTTASRLGLFGTSTAPGVRLALFNESGVGLPMTMLAETASLQDANGAVEGPLASSVTLTAGAHYWIAAIGSTNMTIGFTPGGSGYVFNNITGWPNIPTTFPAGASSVTTETPDLYVVLQDQ